MRQKIDYNIEITFSIILTCLITRVMANLEFHETAGPLIQILFKMFKDFINFSVLFALLVIMFSISGNINFIMDIPDFEQFLPSVLAVINASIGNYDFDIFDTIPIENGWLFGYIYTIAIMVTFNIVVFNYLIAVLS